MLMHSIKIRQSPRLMAANMLINLLQVIILRTPRIPASHIDHHSPQSPQPMITTAHNHHSPQSLLYHSDRLTFPGVKRGALDFSTSNHSSAISACFHSDQYIVLPSSDPCLWPALPTIPTAPQPSQPTVALLGSMPPSSDSVA